MTLPLLPLPSTVETRLGGPFRLTTSSAIHVPPRDLDLAVIGQRLSDFIGLSAGPDRLPVHSRGTGGPGSIRLLLGDVAEAGDDAYELDLSSDGVTLTARCPAGLFYGVQTFRQLLPPYLEHRALRFEKERSIAAAPVRIVDAPRFAWRGAMLDVARHFFAVDEVERYLDLLALYKLNRLHLHLSDDQGWRIEIRSWPELARVGGSTQVGGGKGGFYTQEDYARIVRYAAERFITIVPEIDMPGHTHAALVSYPELSGTGLAPPPYSGTDVGFSALAVDRDVTWRFVDDVIGEIAALTPGPYIHIGGDEVRALTAPEYARFIARVQRVVQAHGKEAIGWDEVAHADLLPTTIVQHWRPDGSPAEAVNKGARLIASVANRAYLDMKYDPATPIGQTWAGCIDVRDAYDWDPADVVPGTPPDALLGVEAPLWSETAATMRDVELLAFPRLAAIAEVGWSHREGRRWEDFRARLGAQAPRWSALGINYYRSPAIEWLA
jgi:hexosaminidase